MDKAIIYTRVSTKAQVKNTSLESQLEECKRLAENKGLEVVGHFTDVASRVAYASRSGLQQALTLMETSDAKVLICYTLDRLGGGSDLLNEIKSRVRKCGGIMLFTDKETPGSAVNEFDDLLFKHLAIYKQQVREECIREMKEQIRQEIEAEYAQRYPYLRLK